MIKLVYQCLKMLLDGSGVLKDADNMANNFLKILENAINGEFITISMNTLKAVSIALVVIALTIKLLDNIRMDQVTEDIIFAYFLKIGVCMVVISLTPEIMKLLVELIVGIYHKISNITLNNSLINLETDGESNIYVFLSKTKETNQMVRKFDGVWGCKHLLRAHYTMPVLGLDLPNGSCLIMILIFLLLYIGNLFIYVALGLSLISPIILILVRLFFLPVVIVQYTTDNAQAMLAYFKKLLASGLTCVVVLIAIIVSDSFSTALTINSGKDDYTASDFEKDIDIVLSEDYSEDGSDMEEWVREYLPIALNYAQSSSNDDWIKDYEVKEGFIVKTTNENINTVGEKVDWISNYITGADFNKSRDLSEFHGVLFGADDSYLNNYLNYVKDELSAIDDDSVIITTKNIDDLTINMENIAMLILSRFAFIAIMFGIGKLANDIFGVS